MRQNQEVILLQHIRQRNLDEWIFSGRLLLLDRLHLPHDHELYEISLSSFHLTVIAFFFFPGNISNRRTYPFRNAVIVLMVLITIWSMVCWLESNGFLIGVQFVRQNTRSFVSMVSVDDLVDEDSAEPEDFIVSAGDLDDEDAEIVEDDGELPGWHVHANNLLELRTQYRRHETDTGSPEFQVAGMTERITYLTKHLKLHPKDFSTRRGLVALVNKRRRLLNYLFSENQDKYTEIVSSLGIRHKAPGNVETKEDKYGRFPKQKDNKRNQKSKFK
jgi:small subunit ribosomal protein S15